MVRRFAAGWRTTAAAATVLLAGTPTARLAAQAQGPSPRVAYFAQLFTPSGGLAPLPPLTGTGAEGGHLRFGHIDLGEGDRLQTAALTVDLRAVAGTRIGATVGYARPRCRRTDCAGFPMAALNLSATLLDVPFAWRPNGTEGPQFTIALDAGVGVSQPDLGEAQSFRALAATIRFPLGVTTGGPTSPHLALFVAPGFGYGRLSVGSAEASDVLPLLGAGVALSTPGQRVGVTAGAQKIIVFRGAVLYGAGVSLRRGK